MAEREVLRKLTAILATDVVGYSRLMEVDVPGTLAQMKAHRLERLAMPPPLAVASRQTACGRSGC